MADDPMRLALEAARAALSGKDIPIGAALCIDGAVVATAHNRIVSQRALTGHAEHMLLVAHGGAIFEAGRRGAPVTLYTTLEPCLMCLGTSAHSRVSRLVFACRDPVAGAGRVEPPSPWYRGQWPDLEHDVANERAAADLLLAYTARRPKWGGFERALREAIGLERPAGM